MKIPPSLAGRLWRYPVYLLACAAVLMGSYWLLLLSAPRGWGGRSLFQMLLFAALIVVTPSAISLFFGFRAIHAARERIAGRAVVSALVAVSAVPLAWLITITAHSRRMLPF